MVPWPEIDDLILDPGNPLLSARTYVAQHHTVDDVPALVHHGGLFYAYDGHAYEDLEDAAIRARLYAFLDDAQRWTEPRGDTAPKRVAFKPTKQKIENIIDALKALCYSKLPAPCWLTEADNVLPLDPFDLVACSNGAALPTRHLLPPSPRFFSVNGLPFAFAPDAPAPARWRAFLEQLWPNDEDAKATLQDWFGYLLTPRTSQQKILMLVGPKRWARAPSAAWSGDCSAIAMSAARRSPIWPSSFGLATLVGKSAAIIADARLSNRADASIVTERLLSISGEDTISVPRKYLPDLTCTLPTRFMLMTNELPRIEDQSGALASRFLLLTLRKSFFGHEDHDLFDRFVPELPGILNWALDGAARLAARRRFVQPPCPPPN